VYLRFAGPIFFAICGFAICEFADLELYQIWKKKIFLPILASKALIQISADTKQAYGPILACFAMKRPKNKQTFEKRCFILAVQW
jgi:hypothetical protein